ncbi:tetratricopeptide repeat protein [Metapseudomonas otitidis]|uniref:tetratricopeptide repeat protein n=1 Tax=Metapseudomonas otitidis TaxID=319939 RepID=UPI003EE162D1
MKKNIALFLALPFSLSISAKTINLAPSFGNANKIEFFYSDFPSGDRSISAILAASEAPGKTVTISNICDPEGGDAMIGNVATVARNSTHGDILAITCIYKLRHTGIGLTGTQYQAKIFEKTKKILKKPISEEELLSGFEGQYENEDESFYFYKKPEFFREKLRLITEGKESDSIELTHAIAIETLDKYSADTAGKYLSKHLIKSLFDNYPLTKKNAPLYNDIGYVLVEAKKMKQALSILLPIKEVAPDRIYLYLNIADAYWPTQKEIAQKYYEEYQTLMIKKGKREQIPERVKTRTEN